MNKTFMPKKRYGYLVPLLLVLVVLMPHVTVALTGSQVYERVKDSVVVVTAYDRAGKAVGLGSGVVLPSGDIATNYHVVRAGMGLFSVGQRGKAVPAVLVGSKPDKDLAILGPLKEYTVELQGHDGKTSKNEKVVRDDFKATPARLGQASRLKVGEPVYAVGAPQGLELSLSEGIVSQLRGGPPPLIQTTAAISPGSSGGGLFNSYGELVGITSFYLKEGQGLNFAVPVEWVKEIPISKGVILGYADEPQTQGGGKGSDGDWLGRSRALFEAQDRQGRLAHCLQWIQAEPGSVLAWNHLGSAYLMLGHYQEAIKAYRESLRLKPDDANTWQAIGTTYTSLGRYQEAFEAYSEALQLKPDALTWYTLGFVYAKLGHYQEAIKAYRESLRLKPDNDFAWHCLAIAYAQSGNRAEALKAVNELRKYNPQDADELANQIIKP
jgi:tetratricopeptide (TPR) repeat protein